MSQTGEFCSHNAGNAYVLSSKNYGLFQVDMSSDTKHKMENNDLQFIYLEKKVITLLMK